MFVTVAICTWNRADLLDQTLRSMRDLVIPQDTKWELLVVNNNSTDATDQVLERHSSALPLTRLFEPKQGKSHALNHAVSAAKGDWILWTDDDVITDANWLSEHVRAIKELPDATYFAGRIDPVFEISPPNWLRDGWSRISNAYAGRQLGECRFAIEQNDDLPFGANFAIRTDVQRAYPYNQCLGRVGSSDIRGEETEILRKMLADGQAGYWIPTASVQHFIPRDRMSLEYVRKWFYGIGQTMAMMGISGRANPRKLFRRAMKSDIKYRWQRVFRDPEKWIDALAKSQYEWGVYDYIMTQKNRDSVEIRPEQELPEPKNLPARAA